jgi:hypothetical protein
MSQATRIGMGVGSNDNTVALTMGFDNFFLESYVADRPPIEPVSNEFSFPAERPHLLFTGTGTTNTWNINSTVTGAFGSMSMQSGPNFNDNRSDNLNGPQMQYYLNFPSAGDWYVWVRMRREPSVGNSSSRDSIHLGLNGQAVTLGSFGLSDGITHTQFNWLNMFNGSRVKVTVPTAGTHVVNVWQREAGTLVDHFFLSQNQNATPPTLSTSLACNISPYELWAARYTRTITVTDPTTLTFNLSGNDGYRLYLDGLAVGGNLTNSGNQSGSYTPETLQPGSHEIMIEYVAQYASDGNHLQLQYVLESPVFHTDANPGGNYAENQSASIILEGEINLAGQPNAALTWWDRYDVGNQDTMYVEINEVAGGMDEAVGQPSNWVEVYSRTAHTSNDWKKRLVDLSPYAGQKISIRFRLSALNTDDEDDGWYIDDIEIAD